MPTSARQNRLAQQLLQDESDDTTTIVQTPSAFAVIPKTPRTMRQSSQNCTISQASRHQLIHLILQANCSESLNEPTPCPYNTGAILHIYEEGDPNPQNTYIPPKFMNRFCILAENQAAFAAGQEVSFMAQQQETFYHIDAPTTLTCLETEQTITLNIGDFLFIDDRFYGTPEKPAGIIYPADMVSLLRDYEFINTN